MKESFIKALDNSSCHYKHIEESLAVFVKKLELLKETRRYERLLGDIKNCNDMSNMKALVAEVAFAFEFEAKSEQLEYEVNIDSEATSVDFLWKLPELELDVYLEQRLILQSVTNHEKDNYLVREITRPQSIILSKCQDRNGNIVKFLSKSPSSINIIVVDNSYGITGMFDRIDCQMAAYGDKYVQPQWRLGIYGFFENESDETPLEQKEFNRRYENLRQIIHGILFIKKQPEGDPLNFNYAYYFTPNYLIFSEEKTKELAKRFSQVLTEWKSS